MKRLKVSIEVVTDLPDEKNDAKVLAEYKEGVFDLIKSESDDNAEIEITLSVLE